MQQRTQRPVQFEITAQTPSARPPSSMHSFACTEQSSGCATARMASGVGKVRGKLRFVIQLRTFVDKADPDVNSQNPPFSGKAQIDALLLKLPGVSARKINGLDAYFVSDKMFACISGSGVGLRLPAATATELQFARDNVVPFQPGGMPSSREWIQIDRAHAADYEKDLPLFLASLEFVKTARTR